MRARYHGEIATAEFINSLPSSSRAQLRPDAPPSVGFMFGDLTADPANRLPEHPRTIQALAALGQAIADDPGSAESSIPAAYTYFGQFIDHDITNTQFDASVPGDILKQTDFLPIPAAELGGKIRNARTPEVDLESVYEGEALGAINPDGSMRLGVVSPAPFGTIVTADKNHDLPRLDKSTNDDLDRKAVIGDPRNDENLLVAQLHVAFLRSHNALMERDGLSGADAQVALRRRYQWAVLHDFLLRVCDKAVAAAVVRDGATAWPVVDRAHLFMPVEFAGAAYRFGHSMIRGGYSHNVTFPAEPFLRFFTFTALSGDLAPGATPTPPPPLEDQPESLPDNWIIDWPRFFSPPGDPKVPGQNPARRLDTRLTPPLGELPDTHGRPIRDVMGKLASRNLLRGYLLGLPTGQAVAHRLGVEPLAVQILEGALPASAVDQVRAAGLLERTPLWFYILAEAGDPSGPDGQHLGTVGSRIVAETLWNMVKFAKDSVVDTPPSDAELATGEFSLKGIVKIGQDIGMNPLALDLPGPGA